MRSSQCESGSSHNTSGSPRDQHHSAMSPVHSSSLMLALLFISLIPITRSAPVLLNPSSIEQDQLLTQITTLCSFYLSADPSFRTSDVLEDLCFLMLGSLQKSKDITAHETSKRHPHWKKEENQLKRRTFKNQGGSRAEGTFFIGHEMEDLLSMCKTIKNSVPTDPILQMCDPEQENLKRHVTHIPEIPLFKL